MKANANRTQSRQAGFSMIEVLVASSILVVIVMMLGMLFQQTSLAWRTGVKRASGYMQVRGAIGAIQRDASAAVDARSIPKALKDKLGGDAQSFSGSLKFYTLNGTGSRDESKPGATPLRALTYVTYSTAGARTEAVLDAEGNRYDKPSANVLAFAGLGSASSPTLGNMKAVYGDLNPLGLPLYITFDASVSSSGANLDIGAASAGPDKMWNTKDDIKTWVDN